ncbi:MAG: hypothetical protein KAV87_32690 [Desulfobacteraceae bacterium]|nr:hypothetical protein [Desulfobacteraceae bacterium]
MARATACSVIYGLACWRGARPSWVQGTGVTPVNISHLPAFQPDPSEASEQVQLSLLNCGADMSLQGQTAQPPSPDRLAAGVAAQLAEEMHQSCFPDLTGSCYSGLS